VRARKPALTYPRTARALARVEDLPTLHGDADLQIRMGIGLTAGSGLTSVLTPNGVNFLPYNLDELMALATSTITEVLLSPRGQPLVNVSPPTSDEAQQQPPFPQPPHAQGPPSHGASLPPRAAAVFYRPHSAMLQHGGCASALGGSGRRPSSGGGSGSALVPDGFAQGRGPIRASAQLGCGAFAPQPGWVEHYGSAHAQPQLCAGGEHGGRGGSAAGERAMLPLLPRLSQVVTAVPMWHPFMHAHGAQPPPYFAPARAHEALALQRAQLMPRTGFAVPLGGAPPHHTQLHGRAQPIGRKPSSLGERRRPRGATNLHIAHAVGERPTHAIVHGTPVGVFAPARAPGASLHGGGPAPGPHAVEREPSAEGLAAVASALAAITAGHQHDEDSMTKAVAGEVTQWLFKP
jgi:hypothetical protein